MQSDTASHNPVTKDQHAKLTRIAVTANVFVWVVLIFYVLAAGARWFSIQTLAAQSGLVFSDQMSNNPAYTLDVYLTVASRVMEGIIAALVLKAASLGLFMIVETDLNYRAAKEKEAAQ